MFSLVDVPMDNNLVRPQAVDKVAQQVLIHTMVHLLSISH
jgi:hypothetical protein